MTILDESKAIPSRGLSSRQLWIGILGLLLVCVFFSCFRWLRMDGLEGDPGRWMLEVYRVSLGETPYRDFTWQYGPLAPYLVGGILRLFGASFLTLQVLLDGLASAIVIVCYVLASRFTSPWLAFSLALLVCTAGGTNTGNFALFSLAIYSPAVLTGTLGILLFLLGAHDDWHQRKGFALGNLGMGFFLCALSKPEFALSAGLFVGLRLLILSRGRIAVLLVTVFPAMLGSLWVFQQAGFSRVLAGLSGYGMASVSCPWWPTGYGLVTILAAISQTVMLVAALSCCDRRDLWKRYRMAYGLVLLTGLTGLIGTAFLMRSSVATLSQIYSARIPFSAIILYLLSTSTVLLPLLWGMISTWAAFAYAWSRERSSSTAYNVLLWLCIWSLSARSLFSSILGDGTSVSPAAYAPLLIFGPILLSVVAESLLTPAGSRRLRSVLMTIVLAYSAIRAAGFVYFQHENRYSSIATRAGQVTVADLNTTRIYKHVEENTEPGAHILELPYGGGYSFAAHLRSSVATTQFKFFMPPDDIQRQDVAGLTAHPPVMVIADDSPTLGAIWGPPPSARKCPFPHCVWTSEPIGTRDETVEAVKWILREYEAQRRFGGKLILSKKTSLATAASPPLSP
jgi:hypothetical protein